MEYDMESHEASASCREIFALLSDYLNLELPPEACKEIEGHIAGCAPCVEFVESLRKTVDLCRKYKPEELPAPIGKEAREQLLRSWKNVPAAG